MDMFLVEVLIRQNGWDYKEGQTIFIPVRTNNKRNSIRKVESRYNGSEYPFYEIVRSIECDDFLFKPIM